MSKKTEFSIYELGIIKNSLSDRIVNIQDLKSETVVHNDDLESNTRIEIFSLELTGLKDKIVTMINEKIDD